MCGFFHTYPTLSGPFLSLQEVQDATDSEHAQQCEMMCMDGLSMIERKVRRALYWPDGIRRNTLEAQAFEKGRKPAVWMLKALLDKHNEDNNLLEDLAYELVEILRVKAIREPKGSLYRFYYHINLMIKTKGADDGAGNLFFAEVLRKDHKEYALSCICMLKPDEKGQCYGCTCSGRVDMNHPSDEKYRPGDPNTHLPCTGYIDEYIIARAKEWNVVYNDDELKEQEDRVRLECKVSYDPDFARVHKDPSADGDGPRTGKYIVPARRSRGV